MSLQLLKQCPPADPGAGNDCPTSAAGAGQPVAAVPWLRSAVKKMIPRCLLMQRLNRRAKDRVLLTFDDGPHPEVTPAVLDRLAAWGARGVFFVVGHRIDRAPHLLARIRTHGHVIGNHSYIHANGRQLRPLEYRRDLLRCQKLVARHTGSSPRMFRPPLGRTSPTTLLVPRLLGLQSIGWSLDSGDWRCRTPAAASVAAEHVKHSVMPGDIVLLHDSHPAVLTILDALLPELNSRNIDFHDTPLLNVYREVKQ